MSTAEVFPPLPPKVAAALTTVMGKIQKLGKDETNPHANYKYAGIEAFLEMLRPLCASAGLLIIQDEEDFMFRDAMDKYGKPLTWLVITFSFGLAHSSGETWPYRCKRTSMVQASMGSQAFGAGQSYALKSFLRSIGLIATGDTEDADSHEQRELPKIKSKQRARKDYDADMLKAGIDAQQTPEALREWGLNNQMFISQQPDSQQRFLRESYQARMTELKEGVDEEGKPVLSISDDLRKKLELTAEENAIIDRTGELEPGAVESDENGNGG